MIKSSSAASIPAAASASRDAATAALDRAGVTYEVVTVPGVDHGFFNDTGGRHNPSAAAAIYEQLTAWFGRYLST